MTYATRPQVNAVLDLAILEPTAAILLEDGALVVLVEVSVDVVECVLLDVERADVLVLDLLHHLDGVLDGRLDRWQQRT